MVESEVQSAAAEDLTEFHESDLRKKRSWCRVDGDVAKATFQGGVTLIAETNTAEKKVNSSRCRY